MSPADDGTRENPMTAMTEPVTSGGNRCRIRPNHGASATVTSPATMVAPNTAARPCSWPMSTAGVIAVNVDPITIGNRAPNHLKPSVCSSVARPLTRRFALISSRIRSSGRSSATPTSSGMVARPE
ncbi:hypothetical protein OHA20_13600 [Streptomyces sp. NBC_01579]